jgi:hypothetical protein
MYSVRPSIALESKRLKVNRTEEQEIVLLKSKLPVLTTDYLYYTNILLEVQAYLRYYCL